MMVDSSKKEGKWDLTLPDRKPTPDVEELEVVDLCRDLVRIPSPSGQEGQIAGVVAAKMKDLGYDEVSVDEYGSVIGLCRGWAPGPSLLFDAHLDTVPVINPQEWGHNPFGGEVSQGRIWGCGAADTKGSLAAIICAVGRLPRETFAGQIIVVATVCEETATGAALSHVLKSYPVDVVVVGEPTELRLGVAQKGRVRLLVESHGRSAHTSCPELGENAVYRMIEAITRLRLAPRRSDPVLGQEVFELVEIASESTSGPSFVPYYCCARFVQRILPGQTQQAVLSQHRSSLSGLEGIFVQIESLEQVCYTGKELVMVNFVPAWHMDANCTWQQKIKAGMREAGLIGETFVAPYCTNGSASAGLRGMPTYILGPGSIEQAHTVDEWIAIEDLVAGEWAYSLIARACLG